jgi:hypothetical protein
MVEFVGKLSDLCHFHDLLKYGLMATYFDLVEAQGDYFSYREREVDLRMLWQNRSDLCEFTGFEIAYFKLIVRDHSSFADYFSTQQLEKSGLPRTVWSEDSQYFSRLHFKADLINDLTLADAVMNVFCK